MKIYIVTCGEYSDYGISAVFRNKEKAYAYAAMCNGKYISTDYHVEEYETHDDRLLVAYDVPVYKTVRVDRFRDKFEISTGYWAHTGSFEKKDTEIDKYCKEIDVTVSIDTTDDQILKIAQDVYAKWKAEKESI